MQKLTKRAISFVLVLVLCVGILSGVDIRVSAATVNYVTGNPSSKYQNVIKNWGTRGTTATFLSPNAEQFYQDNNVTYDELALLSGSSNTGSVPSSALYQKLNQLVTDNQTKTTSYDDTTALYAYTDCQNSGKETNQISSFYSGKLIGPDWDSGKTWNREHTWPNSKGDANGQGENDIMMLRPTATTENGSRSNKAYGESSNYYNPNSESGGKYDLRGDVARIMLYVYTRWGTQKMWGESGVIESKEVLLKWMQEDPVDTWEMGRNDSVESITGTRNVYVDYPELAFVLFNEEVPADMTTPSGKASGAPTVDLSSGVSVMGHNVYFNEFLQIMYAIYVPEGKTIDKVELTDGKVTFEAVPYTATPTIGDKTCVSYVASQGVAMQAIGTEVTAKVYVDGKIVAQDRYSVLEYLHKRLSVDTNVTTVQKTMYQSLLKYAASAQKVLKPADTSINNYTYIHVNNGTYKGYATGIYLQGGTVALTDLDADGTVLSWNYQIVGGESGILTDTLTIGAQDIILEAVIDETAAPEPSEPSIPTTGEVHFEFGENGTAAHKDGSDIGASKTYTEGSYELALTNASKIYDGAFDQMGNSCLKLGTSSVAGEFRFAVPEDVVQVVIYVAQYKENATKVQVNGVDYTIQTASNSGEYTAITVNTNNTKTVTVTTVSGGLRAMINAIVFKITGTTTPTEPTEPEETEPTVPETEPTVPETEPTVPEETTAPVVKGYVEKQLSEIKATDKVVITMTASNGTVYALANNNGTGTAPSAPKVTVVGDKITSDVGDEILWNLTQDSNGIIIYKNDSTTDWLYSTNTNNGTRVGNNTNKYFVLDSASGYLKHVATNRYLGVYVSNPDWRSYTNTTGNTANQTLRFFVLVEE